MNTVARGMNPGEGRAGASPFAGGRVFVWRVRTDGIWGGLHPAGLLTDDEQARAMKFIAAADRDQWVITRAAARSLLAACADMPVSGIVISQQGREKPVLAGIPWLKFSVSHTRGLSLIAIARDIELGVDVELIEEGRYDIGAARLVFSDEEVRDVLGLPPGDQRTRRFFDRWTLKEAFGKWSGAGLTGALASVTLPLSGATSLPGGPATLFRLSLPAVYAGALCVSGTGHTIIEADYRGTSEAGVARAFLASAEQSWKEGAG